MVQTTPRYERGRYICIDDISIASKKKPSQHLLFLLMVGCLHPSVYISLSLYMEVFHAYASPDRKTLSYFLKDARRHYGHKDLRNQIRHEGRNRSLFKDDKRWSVGE